MIRSIVIAAALAAVFAFPARAGVEDEGRAFFERFVAAQNAHDAKAVQDMLLDAGHFLWITRGTQLWGREAAMQNFAKRYEGTWKLEPEWRELKVMPVGTDTAHLVVPVVFTVGAPGQAATQARLFINQILVKTPAGWRISSILPVPAPAP